MSRMLNESGVAKGENHVGEDHQVSFSICQDASLAGPYEPKARVPIVSRLPSLRKPAEPQGKT